VVVGRLGTLHFAAGYYVYVGSALNNLAGRIQRHLALTKKKHWHIDYLRPSADIVSVYLIRSRTRCECALAQAIARLADDHVPQFGSSDCRCRSHLFYFRRNPVECPDFSGLCPDERMSAKGAPLGFPQNNEK
jgi:sugar fermentation stimulation protein A